MGQMSLDHDQLPALMNIMVATWSCHMMLQPDYMHRLLLVPLWFQ